VHTSGLRYTTSMEQQDSRCACALTALSGGSNSNTGSLSQQQCAATPATHRRHNWRPCCSPYGGGAQGCMLHQTHRVPGAGDTSVSTHTAEHNTHNTKPWCSPNALKCAAAKPHASCGLPCCPAAATPQVGPPHGSNLSVKRGVTVVCRTAHQGNARLAKGEHICGAGASTRRLAALVRIPDCLQEHKGNIKVRRPCVAHVKAMMTSTPRPTSLQP
jgi:hypothetical protein